MTLISKEIMENGTQKKGEMKKRKARGGKIVKSESMINQNVKSRYWITGEREGRKRRGTDAEKRCNEKIYEPGRK